MRGGGGEGEGDREGGGRGGGRVDILHVGASACCEISGGRRGGGRESGEGGRVGMRGWIEPI